MARFNVVLKPSTHESIIRVEIKNIVAPDIETATIMCPMMMKVPELFEVESCEEVKETDKE